MSDSRITAEAAELLYREALHLDRQAWDAWLALYLPDAEFWVPAWKGEHQPTENPDRELSLFYYSSRRGLEERVIRVRSGKSVTTLPLPRTAHLVGNVIVEPMKTPEAIAAFSTWTVHLYHPKDHKQTVLFGRYEHHLRRTGDGWAIARKKVILLNDRIPTLLDFYCL